jgi:iron complex outermembrane receptor protein
MKMLRLRAVLLFTLLFVAFGVSALAGSGRIEGHVTREDGSPVAGVLVVIEGTPAANVTDAGGFFEFKRVRAGRHSLRFSLADYPIVKSDASVTAGATTTVDQVVDWDVGFVETITVQSASRRRERIVDAPSAVTKVSEDEIESQAAHGLVPKLFEFTPGVDITQISAAEFLVSTRGFNSNLNRRTAVLQDGRDLTDPFAGAMEWPTISVPLDDLQEVELVRGPTSALYGANATGGVVSLTTKEPRSSPGGRIRLAAGEESTKNADFRWAGGLGNDWYVKATGSRHVTDGFSVSRVSSVEYSRPCDDTAVPPVVTNCLPLDNPAFPELPEDDIEIDEGSLRVDKYLADGSVFTLEGGTTEYAGPIFVNATGRGQLRDVEKPWARFNFSSDHWNVLAYYNKRDAEAVNLNTTGPFLLDAHNYAVEVQTHWYLADSTVRIVGGASYFEEEVDSNAQLKSVDTDEEAVFGQIDWQVNDHLKLVGALRWDQSTLHDDQVSPKGAIVYNVNPRHTVRVTYNEAFQLPTYAEYFLYFRLAGLDLSSLQAICDPSLTIDCGFGDPTPLLAGGNESLKLEETTTWEVGYKGVLGGKALLTLDLFDSENENFVTPLVPQLTPGGRTNPNYGPWQAPPGIPPAQEQAVRDASVALIPPGSELSNYGTSPIVMFLTFSTVGQVDTRGADLGLRYFWGDGWSLSASYSWLDFDIKGGIAPAVAHVVQPNAPERKASLGLSYAAERWNAAVHGRWVEEFHWVNSATYMGRIPTFSTVDVSGNYDLNESWRAGVYIANVFEDEHWEAWGADLLPRRALAHLTYSW